MLGDLPCEAGPVEPGPSTEEYDARATVDGRDVRFECTDFYMVIPEVSGHDAGHYLALGTKPKVTLRNRVAYWKRLKAKFEAGESLPGVLVDADIVIYFDSKRRVPRPLDQPTFLVELRSLLTPSGGDCKASKIIRLPEDGYSSLRQAGVRKLEIAQVTGRGHATLDWNGLGGSVGASEDELLLAIGSKYRTGRPRLGGDEAWLLITADDEYDQMMGLGVTNVEKLQGYSRLAALMTEGDGGITYDRVVIHQRDYGRVLQWAHESGWVETRV